MTFICFHEFAESASGHTHSLPFPRKVCCCCFALFFLACCLFCLFLGPSCQCQLNCLFKFIFFVPLWGKNLKPNFSNIFLTFYVSFLTKLSSATTSSRSCHIVRSLQGGGVQWSGEERWVRAQLLQTELEWLTAELLWGATSYDLSPPGPKQHRVRVTWTPLWLLNDKQLIVQKKHFKGKFVAFLRSILLETKS